MGCGRPLRRGGGERDRRGGPQRRRGRKQHRGGDHIGGLSISWGAAAAGAGAVLHGVAFRRGNRQARPAGALRGADGPADVDGGHCHHRPHRRERAGGHGPRRSHLGDIHGGALPVPRHRHHAPRLRGQCPRRRPGRLAHHLHGPLAGLLHWLAALPPQVRRRRVVPQESLHELRPRCHQLNEVPRCAGLFRARHAHAAGLHWSLPGTKGHAHNPVHDSGGERVELCTGLPVHLPVRVGGHRGGGLLFHFDHPSLCPPAPEACEGQAAGARRLGQTPKGARVHAGAVGRVRAVLEEHGDDVHDRAGEPGNRGARGGQPRGARNHQAALLPDLHWDRAHLRRWPEPGR
mmetsp:Transcript_4757/g.12078  ORF Transcript_4757/g.12078 Transcript_4757/m.12078 type:complete len:347 (-) Transcript_4757:86-1126(-)